MGQNVSSKRPRRGWLVLLILGAALWWYHAQPACDLGPEPVTPNPNGWTVAVEASDLLVFGRKHPALLLKGDALGWETKLPELGGKSLGESLDANQPALEKLREALQLEFVQPADQAAVMTASTDFAKLRELARCLLYHSQRQASRGAWNDALAARLEALQLAQKITGAGGLMCRLVGVSVDAMALRDSAELVPHLDGPTAATAARRVEALLSTAPTLADTLRAERRNDLAYYREQLGSPRWRWAAFRLADRPDWRILLSSTRSYLRAAARNYDRQIAEAEKPYPERDLSLGSPSVIEALTGPLELFGGLCCKTTTRQADVRMFAVALALRAYEADHDTLPAQLTELVPDYLKAVPTDPFTVDQPLRYRRDGESYVLYSLGPDGESDGGLPSHVEGNPKQPYIKLNSDADMVWGVNR